jgi:hypothetical protein
MTMRLELWGFFAKCASNAFTKLQLCSRPGGVDIRETFSAKILHLPEKFLERGCATREFVDRSGNGRFGARTGLFRYFCSCHRM